MPRGTLSSPNEPCLRGSLSRRKSRVSKRAGALVSKTETAFNPATGQAVKRETVVVSGNTVTKTEERLVNGQVVKREIETVTISNGQRVQIEREFQLVNGQLVEVKHEQKVKEVEKVKGVKDKVKEVEKKEVEKIEKADDPAKEEADKAQSKNEAERGGRGGGGDSGGDGKKD